MDGKIWFPLIHAGRNLDAATRRPVLADTASQYHTKPWCNLGAKPLGPETLGCNVLQEYDGAAVIEVDSFEVLEKAFADQYYQTIIAEDEERFLDKSAGVLRTRAEAKKIIKML